MACLVRPLLLASATVGFLAAGCTSPLRAFCEAQAACDDLRADPRLDRVGASRDSIEVCVVEEDGLLAALRTNDEPDCHDAALARERWHACVAELFAQGEECAAFLFGDANECEDELDDFQDAIDDAGDECGSNER